MAKFLYYCHVTFSQPGSRKGLLILNNKVWERRISRGTKFISLLKGQRGRGQGDGENRKTGQLFISYHSQPTLIKTSLQMYISREPSAGRGGLRLCNHKEVSVIYLMFGFYPLPPQASPTPPPRCPQFITSTLCIHHKQEGHIWALVWTSVMNLSNRLFPSKVIFYFIAVCLCILPNDHWATFVSVGWLWRILAPEEMGDRHGMPTRWGAAGQRGSPARRLLAPRRAGGWLPARSPAPLCCCWGLLSFQWKIRHQRFSLSICQNSRNSSPEAEGRATCQARPPAGFRWARTAKNIFKRICSCLKIGRKIWACRTFARFFFPSDHGNRHVEIFLLKK